MLILVNYWPAIPNNSSISIQWFIWGFKHQTVSRMEVSKPILCSIFMEILMTKVDCKSHLATWDGLMGPPKPLKIEVATDQLCQGMGKNVLILNEQIRKGIFPPSFHRKLLSNSGFASASIYLLSLYTYSPFINTSPMAPFIYDNLCTINNSPSWERYRYG